MAMVTLSGVSGAFATGPSCSGDSLEVETPGEVTVHARNWADVLADGGCGYRVRSRASFEDGQGEWDFEGDIDVAASYAWQRWWQWATDGSGGWRRSWSKPSLERCTFDLAPQGWGEYEVEVRSGSCTEDVTLTVKPQIVGIAVEHAAVAVAGWDEDTERIVLYYEPNSGNSEFDTYIDGRDSLLGWVKLRSQLDADGAAPDTTDAAKVDFIDPTDATESLDLTGFGKVMETSAGDRFAILRNDDGEDSTFFMAVDDGTGEFYAALDGDGEVIALHEVDALDGAKFGVNYPVLVEDESGNDVVMLVYMADLYKQAITAELSDALDPADHSADWLGNSIRWLFGAVPADLDELVLSPELDPDELQDLVVDRLLDGAGEGLTTLELCDGDSEISEKAQALFPMGDWCKRTTAIDPVVVRTWRDEEEVVLVLGDVGAAWLSSWVLVDEDDTPSLSGRRLRYEGQLITTDEAEEFLDDDVTVCMLIDPAAVTDPLTGVLHVYATMRLSYSEWRLGSDFTGTLDEADKPAPDSSETVARALAFYNIDADDFDCSFCALVDAANPGNCDLTDEDYSALSSDSGIAATWDGSSFSPATSVGRTCIDRDGLECLWTSAAMEIDDGLYEDDAAYMLALPPSLAGRSRVT